MTRTEDTSPTWNSSLSASLVAGPHLHWSPKLEVRSKISAPSNFQLQPMQCITMPINPPAATARCREFSTLLSSWLSKHRAEKESHVQHCALAAFPENGLPVHGWNFFWTQHLGLTQNRAPQKRQESNGSEHHFLHGFDCHKHIADAISWWLALKTHHQRGIHHFLPHWLLVPIFIEVQNRKCDRKFLHPAIFSFSQCSASPCLSTHQLLQHGAENSAPCSAAGCRSTERKNKVMSSTVLWLHFRRMDSRSMAETFSEHNIWVWRRIGHHKNVKKVMVQNIISSMVLIVISTLRTQSADDSHWRHITNVEFITFCLTGCWSPSSLKSKIGSAIENFCTQQFSASANAVHHHAYQPTSCYSTVPRIQHPAQQLAVEARSGKTKSCPALCFGCISGEWTPGPWLKLFLNTTSGFDAE